MNGDKARDLFSEYREGTLSPSLRASLEQSLNTNSALNAEYEAYNNVVESLESDRIHTVIPPFDLHNRIMTRVDKQIYETSRTVKSSWFSGWRLALLGGVACLAVVGTFTSINSKNSNSPAASGIGSVQLSQPGLDIKLINGNVRLTHGVSSAIVVVKDDLTGDLIGRFDLQGKSLDSPLTNEKMNSVLVSIRSDIQEAFVALPGSLRKTETEGRGTMKQLALALSDLTGQAVQLDSKDLTNLLAWHLDDQDVSHSKAVVGSFNIEIRKGLIYLTD